MRNLSVSNEMILIAGCGVLNGVIGVFKNAVEIIENDFRCVHSFFYYALVFFHFAVFGLINQIIFWQIVYITFLRAAVVLNVLRGIKVEKTKLNMRRFIYIIFTIYFVNHMIRCSFHRIEEYTDKAAIQILLNGKQCNADRFYDTNSVGGKCVKRILLTVAGITSVITPILIMCILSIFLVFELRASRATSMSSYPKKNNGTSALLLFLCFYVLAELPYVLLYGVGLYNPADFNALDEYTYTQVDIFIYSNMCVGIIVYCLTSSQYRKTVVDTFWWINTNVVVGDLSSRITT